MAEFLRFGNGQLRNAGSGQIFAHGVGDFGRVDKVFFRDMQVAVIFQHTGIDHLRHAHAVEFVKSAFGRVKSLGDLD